MLLAGEYNFGVRLSRLQRIHSTLLPSYDAAETLNPGNLSKHVLHLETSRAINLQ